MGKIWLELAMIPTSEKNHTTTTNGIVGCYDWENTDIIDIAYNTSVDLNGPWIWEVVNSVGREVDFNYAAQTEI